MGLDRTRFVSEIDEGIRCSICSMVFENPIQTPCEHTFCNECIRTWLSNNTTCPVDRRPLSHSELKSPGRPVLNLLAKLNIKCSFVGCEVIVELEHLQDHLTSCKYNPNSEIICDMKISRHEYDEAQKYIAHLSNRIRHQEVEITERTCELIKNENFEQKEIRHEQEVKNLKEMIINEQKTELNNQIKQLKEQIARRNDVASEPKFGENSNILSNKTPKWRVWKNVCFLDKSNILECVHHYGAAKSNYPLGPEDSFFKVEILHLAGNVTVGLSPPDDQNPTLFDRHDICCSCTGAIFLFGCRSFDVTRKFAVGDIIECGIRSPQKFHGNGSVDVAVYFSKNGKLFYESVVKMRPDQLFPIVSLYGNNGDRVRILSI